MEQACREKPSVDCFCITSCLCAPSWGSPSGGTSEPVLIKVKQALPGPGCFGLWCLIPRTESLAQTEIGTRSGVLLGQTWQVPLQGEWRDFEFWTGKAPSWMSLERNLESNGGNKTEAGLTRLFLYQAQPTPNPSPSEGIWGSP